jgi:MFS transporter, PPP family, 3-phenylpropionic acid transporter
LRFSSNSPKMRVVIDQDKQMARWNISIQYALYFGTMGVFLPYFNLYCYHLGFDGVQIGVLSSLRSLIMVLFSLTWAALADRYHKRRFLYILCNLFSTFVFCFFFFFDTFWSMFIITAFYGIFYAPIIAFLEAFSMDHLAGQKRAYGAIRAWGSIAFISVVILLGWLLKRFDIRIILVFILAGGGFLTLVSLKTPESALPEPPPFMANINTFFDRRVLVFLFCAYLMLVSHGAYYAFLSIYLEHLGFDSGFIGFAWATASIAEIIVMVKSKKFFQHLSFERILAFSFPVAALRWVLLGTLRSGVAILLLQILHAVTYGMFHMASILYMDHLSPEGTKTLGQSINNAVTYGLGLMTGFFVSGFLYERAGAQFSFLVSALIALTGGAVFSGFSLVHRRQVRAND